MPAALIAVVLLVALAAAAAATAVRNAACFGAAGCWSQAPIFSYAQGIFHEYYTVQLAPAISALVRHRSGARLAAHRDRAVARVGHGAGVG
jgi:hypothetical protein